jgi:hypothetical protein
MWLAEVAARVVWWATDAPGVAFVAAMVSVGLSVAWVLRVAGRVLSKTP